MKQLISLSEIAQWIDNDEGLYNWWKSSKQSKKHFLKENTFELRKCILKVLNRKPSR
jgi:hypothetical protein